MPLTRFRLDLPALCDPHMSGPNNETWFGAIGAALDAMAEQIMKGRLAGNPFAGGANIARSGAARLADGRLIECEPAALPAHAAQRNVPIYATEPTLSRRVRIARWWQSSKMGGTSRGHLFEAQPFFLGRNTTGALPRIRIVHQNKVGGRATWHQIERGIGFELASVGRYSITPRDGVNANWNWDNDGEDALPAAWGDIAGNWYPAWQPSTAYSVRQRVINDGRKLYVCTTAGTSASSGGPTGSGSGITDGSAVWERVHPWSRWWAIYYLDGVLPAPAHWDDGIASWDDGVTTWGGLTEAVFADLVSIIQHNKGAHSALWGVAVTWNDDRFDPTTTPTQDADGWWSYPVGNYGRLADPATGLATRPPDVEWIYDRSQ